MVAIIISMLMATGVSFAGNWSIALSGIPTTVAAPARTVLRIADSISERPMPTSWASGWTSALRRMLNRPSVPRNALMPSRTGLPVEDVWVEDVCPSASQNL